MAAETKLAFRLGAVLKDAKQAPTAGPGWPAPDWDDFKETDNRNFIYPAHAIVRCVHRLTNGKYGATETYVNIDGQVYRSLAGWLDLFDRALRLVVAIISVVLVVGLAARGLLFKGIAETEEGSEEGLHWFVWVTLAFYYLRGLFVLLGNNGQRYHRTGREDVGWSEEQKRFSYLGVLLLRETRGEFATWSQAVVATLALVLVAGCAFLTLTQAAVHMYLWRSPFYVAIFWAIVVSSFVGAWTDCTRIDLYLGEPAPMWPLHLSVYGAAIGLVVTPVLAIALTAMSFV